MYAGITVSTLAVYIAFTVSVSSWRTKFREDMNRMENRASHEVLESLMNYETVKVRKSVRFGWALCRASYRLFFVCMMHLAAYM